MVLQWRQTRNITWKLVVHLSILLTTVLIIYLTLLMIIIRDYIGRCRLPRKILRAWCCSVGSVEVIMSSWGIFPNTYGLLFDCREWLFLQVEVKVRPPMLSWIIIGNKMKSRVLEMGIRGVIMCIYGTYMKTLWSVYRAGGDGQLCVT